MTNRELWLETLRSYKDTPYRHQGRTKHVGLDCVGLIVCAGDESGLLPSDMLSDIVGYHRTPDDRLFEKKGNQYLRPLPYNRLQPLSKQMQPGDIIFFWIEKRGYPRHIGVYTGLDDDGYMRMIHTYAKQPRIVTEMRINSNYWVPRIHSIWTLPTLEQ